MMYIASLPSLLPKHPPRPTQSEMPADGPAEDARPDSLRVMVVEDEWLVSMEIEAALEEGGYHCVGVADSADEAIELARTSSPQLVLMDIRLKGEKDGIYAASELHQRFGIRCLFVSANADDGTKERAAASNPIGWLPKPFSAPQLLQAVEAAKAMLRSQ